MKCAIVLKITLAALILAGGGFGCTGKRPASVIPIPPRNPSEIRGVDDPSGLAGVDGNTLSPDAALQGTQLGPDDMLPLSENRELINGMIADREAFSANTVYFDYDRSSVREADTAKIEAVATFLKNEPVAMVQVEGHCDERGTEEYNRALGERRALSVRDYLVNLGVDGNRIVTVSFGEDLPAVEGTDESAYSKNRRAEFVLMRPKP